MDAGQPEDEWWADFRERVDENASDWGDVFEAMKKYECRMEVRSMKGAVWETVPAAEEN